jgi:CRP/FNR family transcriptional regulator, cyclic AMP receptor protein
MTTMTTSVESTRRPRIRIADAFPELLSHLPPEKARVAGHYALATVETLRPGKWRPDPDLQPQPGHMGVLVVEGLMTRDVVLGETVAAELVGRGDVLRPADHDGAVAPVPFDVEWTVLEATQIALLDREFAGVICHWPEAVEVIVRSAVRRAQSLGLHLAVCHLRRVHTRLLVLLWHMADRWGKVTPEGVHVPLKLTHQLLGRVIGAQRPSVTTALKQLMEDGLVSRREDGTWLLHGDPPDTLERMRSSIDARCGEAIAEIE